MSFDMNDAEPQKSGEPIPDGTFAKVTMSFRPGGIDVGIVQDLPDRGGGDLVAEPDRLALHPLVPPTRGSPSRCGSRACGSRLPWTASQDGYGSCSPTCARPRRRC